MERKERIDEDFYNVLRTHKMKDVITSKQQHSGCRLSSKDVKNKALMNPIKVKEGQDVMDQNMEIKENRKQRMVKKTKTARKMRQVKRWEKSSEHQ